LVGKQDTHGTIDLGPYSFRVNATSNSDTEYAATFETTEAEASVKICFSSVTAIGD